VDPAPGHNALHPGRGPRQGRPAGDRKPEGEGHFIVSSRSEQELRRSRTTKHQIIAGCVLIAFFGGLALLVAGILA
jgi:hypothetical protein